MNSYKAKINITLREGILDVQGKTIEHALHSMEFTDLNHVRIGKYVEITVSANDSDSAYQSVASACNKLIANPIVEDYFISIEEIGE